MLTLTRQLLYLKHLIYIYLSNITFIITFDCEKIALMGLPGFADAPQTLIDFEKEKEGKVSKRLVVKDTTSKRSLNILVDYRESVPGCRTFSLYVPYWIINHSQKQLYYKNPEEKSDEAVAIVNCMLFVLYLFLLFIVVFYLFIFIQLMNPRMMYHSCTVKTNFSLKCPILIGQR
jgi:hypothetical protein